ncbi:unnamed protein product [Amoebophrya sp. A25]|nr:unnamed protein product [Amoebophrya sp. A25]|eukprot:GSA25T00004895001.1
MKDSASSGHTSTHAGESTPGLCLSARARRDFQQLRNEALLEEGSCSGASEKGMPAAGSAEAYYLECRSGQIKEGDDAWPPEWAAEEGWATSLSAETAEFVPAETAEFVPWQTGAISHLEEMTGAPELVERDAKQQEAYTRAYAQQLMRDKAAYADWYERFMALQSVAAQGQAQQ